MSDFGLSFLLYQKKTVTIQIKVTFKGKTINFCEVDQIFNELTEHRSTIQPLILREAD